MAGSVGRRGAAVNREKAARMERRKDLAIDFIKLHAKEFVVELTEISWDTKAQNDRWAFRVAWEGGFRVIRVPEDLLTDEDTGQALGGLIQRWFDTNIAPTLARIGGKKTDRDSE